MTIKPGLVFASEKQLTVREMQACLHLIDEGAITAHRLAELFQIQADGARTILSRLELKNVVSVERDGKKMIKYKLLRDQ